MGDAGDAGAGSKIFVGGLDRTVDEGARDDARRRARRDDARDARARDAIDRSIAIDGTIRGVARSRCSTRAATDDARWRRDAGAVRNFFSQFGPVMEVRDARRARGARSTTRWGGR